MASKHELKRKTCWDTDLRMQLKYMLSEGIMQKEIIKDFDISRDTLKSELKRGLTAEEFAEKRYLKYLPVRAIVTEIKELFGDDVFNYIFENEKDLGEGI